MTTATFITECPFCGMELAENLAPHCAGGDGTKPKRCGWVRHKTCGSVVNPVSGAYTAGPTR